MNWGICITVSHARWVLCAALLLAASAATGQDFARQLADAQALLSKANADNADLLAPETFSRGTDALRKAEARFAAGRADARLTRELAEASAALSSAIDLAGRAQRELAAAIGARADAIAAGAPAQDSDAFADAEERLVNAAAALEAGNLDKANARADDAERRLREVELQAIRNMLFGSARQAIEDADEQRTDRFAPRTLARARQLLAEAERLLQADRYAVEEPTRLANLATYEARHARFIRGLAEDVRKGQKSFEDIVLAWEEHWTLLAEAANVPADFSTGYAELAAAIDQELRRVPGLEFNVAELTKRVNGLEEEIRELDDRLGSTSAERSALMRELQARARTREQFATVNALFTSKEADVLRDGDNVILRLVGLRFASGSDQLNAGSDALLQKLRDAFNVFPRLEVVVEGHTDSSGSASRNQALSQRRAQAVADYCVEQLGLPAFRVKAVGYGDTRPIAPNRTAEGRAKNRRIDLLLKPRLVN